MGTIKQNIQKIRTTPILLGGVGGAAVGAGIAYFTGVKTTNKYLIYAGIGLAVGAVACYFICKKDETTETETAKVADTEKKEETKQDAETSENFVGTKNRIRSPYMTKESCEKMTYGGNPNCANFKSSKQYN